MIIIFTLNAIPKKLDHKRGSKTAKRRGAISQKVRKQVESRSQDCCERCGKHKRNCWTLEMAHITRRWQIQGETTANDLIRLCGPSTDSATCHHWADYTEAGREWLEAKGKEIRSRG